MSEDLDLRTIHQSHVPDPRFVADLEGRLEAMLAGTAEAGSSEEATRNLALTHDSPTADAPPHVLPTNPDRRRRRSTPRLLVAAAVAAAVALAVTTLVVQRDSESVDTVEQPDPGAGSTEDPITLARGVVRFAEAPTPNGCCGVPGGLPFPAGQGLGGQTLDIDVEQAGGVVTGRADLTLDDIMDGGTQRSPTTIDFECAATERGDLILGGQVTARNGAFAPFEGDLVVLIIREGEPDKATLWWDVQPTTCEELLQSVPPSRPDDAFVDVGDGGDILTGS